MRARDETFESSELRQRDLETNIFRHRRIETFPVSFPVNS